MQLSDTSSSHTFTKLFIHNIDFRVQNKDIYELFKRYGDIKVIEVPRDKTGKHRGLGFVEFDTHQAAVKALEEANGQFLH